MRTAIPFMNPIWGNPPVSLIQTKGKNYYQILRRKLHWGRPADDPKSDS